MSTSTALVLNCPFNSEQAGAELCQAQVELGLATIEILFHLIDS